MNRITIKHLRYFTALLRHGHFARAAEACHISQPALSIQIRELEDILGALLVERGPRQLHATPFGEVFGARAAEILRAVDDLPALAHGYHAPFSGVLRLGVIPTLAPYLLPRLLSSVAQTYPALDLRPREAITRTLLAGLQDGSLDAAILALPSGEPGLCEHTLFEEEFLLVRPESQADAPVPNAAALRDMRLLLLEEGHCFREQALAYCRASGPSRGDMIEGSSLSTLVQLVGLGLGVTLIPAIAAEVEARSARVSLARLPEPRPVRTVGLLWRHSSPLAPTLQALAALIATCQQSAMAASPLSGVPAHPPIRGSDRPCPP